MKKQQMKMYCILSYCLLSLLCFSKAEYYWKDFHGHIPNDAFPGGRDENGEVTYIGQTYFQQHNFVVPTTIKRNVAYPTVGALGEKLTGYSNNKILCANDHEKFRWINTKTEDLGLLTERQQIYGGHWHDAHLTIGRAKYDGKLLIGMVCDSDVKKWHGLWIYNRNWKNVNLHNFEILTYDPSIFSIDPSYVDILN